MAFIEMAFFETISATIADSPLNQSDPHRDLATMSVTVLLGFCSLKLLGRLNPRKTYVGQQQTSGDSRNRASGP